MANKNVIKIGTKVTWSGSWNTEPEKEVIVEGISKCKFDGDKGGTPIDEIPFEEKDNCIFELDNAHWCYGNQIHDVIDQPEDRPDIEVRVTFRSEVYIKGKTLNEIREKWENMPIFSVDALETYHAEYIEMCSSERVDDNSYNNIDL